MPGASSRIPKRPQFVPSSSVVELHHQPAEACFKGSLSVYKIIREVPVPKPRRNATLADDLVLREELRYFPHSRLRRIRSMHRIFADRFCVRLADGPGGSLGRVGRAHDLSIFRDRVVAFQHLNDDRPGYHEIDELAEERALAVHGVEFFRLLAGYTHALL